MQKKILIWVKALTLKIAFIHSDDLPLPNWKNIYYSHYSQFLLYEQVDKGLQWLYLKIILWFPLITNFFSRNDLRFPPVCDVANLLIPTPCLRSQTSRSTVSRRTCRPKRSCCSGLRGSQTAIRTSAVRTSPPAGGTASCSTPSFTNTSEWWIYWRSCSFSPFNHSRFNNHNKAPCFSIFTQHPHLCILTAGISVITFFLGTALQAGNTSQRRCS